MAIMVDADRNRAARIWCRKTFVQDGTTATLSHADALAAVGAIDTALESTVDTLPGTAGQTLAQRLNQTLPDPFGSTATQPQKGLLISVTAGVKYGYLVGGGE